MRPIIRDRFGARELPIAPIYDDTEITFKQGYHDCVFIYQNDVIIGWLYMPIMKVVKMMRMMFPGTKFNLL